ncbi:MAG TPA: hypothetical protein VF701_06745 [Thermoanaerobaculia bacterium]
MTRSTGLWFALAAACMSFSAGADSLRDVRSAVGKLTARSPVRATYAVNLSVKASGKLANQTSARTLAVEVAHDGNGVTITVPQEIVEKAWQGATRDDAQHAIDGIRPSSLIEALDFRASLLDLLSHATVVTESRVSYRGAPARLLILKLDAPARKKKNEIVIGNVKVVEDRMSMWVSDDNLPLAAERVRKTSAGFLVFRAESSSRTHLTFSRAGDRLVLARLESASGGSALGTKIDESSVQTMTVR